MTVPVHHSPLNLTLTVAPYPSHSVTPSGNLSMPSATPCFRGEATPYLGPYLATYARLLGYLAYLVAYLAYLAPYLAYLALI